MERVKELEKVNKVSKKDDDNTRETQVQSDITKIGVGTTRREAVNERVLSWTETAARAGVLTMVTNQEEPNVVEPMHNGLIAQFDDSVSKIHPYLIRSHSL